MQFGHARALENCTIEEISRSTDDLLTTFKGRKESLLSKLNELCGMSLECWRSMKIKGEDQSTVVHMNLQRRNSRTQ